MFRGSRQYYYSSAEWISQAQNNSPYTHEKQKVVNLNFFYKKRKTNKKKNKQTGRKKVHEYYIPYISDLKIVQKMYYRNTGIKTNEIHFKDLTFNSLRRAHIMAMVDDNFIHKKITKSDMCSLRINQ